MFETLEGGSGFEALGGSASLNYVWKIEDEKFLADSCRIGTPLAHVEGLGVEMADVRRIRVKASLVGVEGLGTGASLGDIWSIGAAMSLVGLWIGTQAFRLYCECMLLASAENRTA